MAHRNNDDLSDTYSFDEIYAFDHDHQGRRVISGATPLQGLDLEFAAEENKELFLSILISSFDKCQQVIQGYASLRAKYDYVTLTRRTTIESAKLLRSRLLSERVIGTFDSVLTVEDLYETLSCLVTLFSK